MLTNDYQRIAQLPPDSPLPEVISAVGAPMEWDGALRGVLTVGYLHSRTITQTDLALLETFAELAAAACANATAHAGLAHVARTDGLTGLPQPRGAARRPGQGDRARAARRAPAAVADPHRPRRLQADQRGPRSSDRRRGAAPCRARVAPRDAPVRPRRPLRRRRVRARLRRRRRGRGDGDGRARARAAAEPRSTSCCPRAARRARPASPSGVEGISATELVARADRALLFAKQEGNRGGVQSFPTVPDHFRPGRFARQDRGLPEPPPMPHRASCPRRASTSACASARARLAIANALGARLSSMTSADEISGGRCRGAAPRVRLLPRVDDPAARRRLRRSGRAAVAHPRRLGAGRPRSGSIGRCVRTRRPVLSNDVRAEARLRRHRVDTARSGPSWSSRCGSATSCGARSTSRSSRPTRSTRTTSPCSRRSPRRSARRCAVRSSTSSSSAPTSGRPRRWRPRWRPRTSTRRSTRSRSSPRPRRSRVELGYTEDALRDLRFAAVFHDIGKIAVPEAILHKPGPLNAEEREVMERHTIVGEQILAPVEFLSDRADARPPRARALGRRRLPGRPRRRRPSRSGRGSSSSATRCTR